jgi:CHAD domain-containing protein
MSQTQAGAEIELKFDADEGFRLPDLGDLPGVAEVGPAQVHDLEAVYFDTADLRLARNRHTLRRRTGGHDAGWHLKRPRRDGFRDELQEPLGEPGAVPPALRRVVAAHVRGAALAPVVTLRTTRTATLLRDADGTVLAEIAEDVVLAEVTTADEASSGGAEAGEARTVRWSELEAELVNGDLALLEQLRARLLAAGARPSDSSSKLARALGHRLATRSGDAGPEPAEGSAGAALLAYVREQAAALVAQDPLVRADAHDAVHQMRVACRRLRAVLAALRPVVDAEAVEPVRAELQWLGEVLGGARDSEVVRDRILALVAAEPPELVRGPVAAFVTETFATRYRAAHDAVLEALDSPRYFALLDSVDALAATAPSGPKAGEPAKKVLRRRLARTYHRVQDHVDDARAASGAEREELFHEVRKSAKRARYAGEAATDVLGDPARRYAKAMKAVQEVLGEHQDSVVARGELAALGEAAQAAGHDAFTYGRLHGVEQAGAERSLAGFDEAWDAARDEARRAGLR